MILFKNPRMCLSVHNLRSFCKAQSSYKARLMKNIIKDKSGKAKLTQRALDHFDKFYQPYYQDIWRSMRIALLSQQKYCAVINNFACKKEATTDLIENGADNIIQLSRNSEVILQDNDSSIKTDEISVVTIEHEPPPVIELTESDDVEYDIPVGHDARLYSFMPAKRVLSEMEEMGQKEFHQNILSSYEQEVIFTGDEEQPFPQCLQVFAHPVGEVGRFREPDTDSTGKFAYHIMDAGALLPVLALGLSPGDCVLDLCAGPGDKALAIAQSLLPESLTCVDHSYTRIKQLKESVKWNLPKSFVEDKKLNIIHADAVSIANKPQHIGNYNKVLVDVPSFNDREALQTAEDRMFSHGNQDIRLNLQNTQVKLLIAGILCCQPGGSVVYSTSTLSPPQNEGIIQQVLEHFQQETEIKLAIQSTKYLTSRLNSFIHFYDKCRFGQLVIPKLTANYGPSYFCKLKKLN